MGRIRGDKISFVVMCVALACAALFAAPRAGVAFEASVNDASPSLVETITEGSAQSSGAQRSVRRLSGADRYDTMSSIVSAGFSSATTVVIASGDNFPDALSASALAGLYHSPILLTSSGTLSKQAIDQINRLGAKRAFVLGGQAAVSSSVTDELSALGLTVRRIAGGSRGETAALVARHIGYRSSVSTVVVANENTPWDSLSVSGYCYANKVPILLTGSSGLGTQELSLIADLGVERVVIVGGPNAVPTGVEDQLADYRVERWYGGTRFETSMAIAQHALDEGLSLDCVALASGLNYPDALAGGAFVGSKSGLVLLTSETDQNACSILSEHKGDVDCCYVLGGVNAMPPAVEQAARKALALADADEPVESNGKTVLAFVPHQDDELLTMGAAICKYIALGYDVHVVLCTDGSGSYVRHTLSDGGTCSFHSGTHSYDLGISEFVTARDAEFLASCEALGVPGENVHIDQSRGKDTQLTVSVAEGIMRSYLSDFDLSNVEVWTTSPLVGDDQNVDHATLANAAEELCSYGEIGELKCFVEPYLVDSFTQSNPDISLTSIAADDEDLRSALLDASAAYCLWSPGSGRYAIGCHSVGGDFSILLNDPPKSLWYGMAAALS